MLVTPSGIMIFVNLSQKKNAESLISITLSGIVTLVIRLQYWNAPSPILVTPSGIAISFSEPL